MYRGRILEADLVDSIIYFRIPQGHQANDGSKGEDDSECDDPLSRLQPGKGHAGLTLPKPLKAPWRACVANRSGFIFCNCMPELGQGLHLVPFTLCNDQGDVIVLLA